MKKLLFATLIFGLTFSIYGQSIINKNLYLANPVQINPAYMGSQGILFLGFQSSLSGDNELDLPTYASINIHSSIFENLAIGTNFLSESQGPFSLTTADIGSAYKVHLDSRQSLRFGMTIGFIRQTLNPSSFSTNVFVDQNDPFLSGDLYDRTHIKLGSGLVYQNGNLELGIGSPYLFRGGESINKEANMTAGYTWYFQQDRLKFNPSFLYRLKDSDANLYDINMRGVYKDKIWLMMGYRSNESVNFAFGLSTEFFDLGYNFNSAMGDLKEINANNHEILVAFTIKNKSKGQLTQDSRASQKYRKVKKGEMDESITRLQQRYDSLAEIASAKQSEEDFKNKLQQEQIEKLREELGIVQAIQENEESQEIEDELLSDKINIEPGNYVVVSTCKSLLCAEQVQAGLIGKGENHSKIVLNKEKGFFYIVTSRFSNFEEALESMERKRKSGYPDSWVLIYKSE